MNRCLAATALFILLQASPVSAQGKCPTDSSGATVCPRLDVRAEAARGREGCAADSRGAAVCAESVAAASATDAPRPGQIGGGQCVTDSSGRVIFDELGRAICAGGCAFGQ